MNISLGANFGSFASGMNGMSGTELENHLWGTTTSMYDTGLTGTDLSVLFRLAADYYLTSFFGLHASLGYEKRDYGVDWSIMTAGFLELNVDYCTITIGPRLFFSKFFLGAEL